MNRLGFIKALLSIPFGWFMLKRKKVISSKSIVLQECFIAGYSYYDGEKVLSELTKGTELTLKLEPQNKYDQYAIEVYFKSKKLGYIPRYLNQSFFKLVENNYQISASVQKAYPNNASWEKIAVILQLNEP